MFAGTHARGGANSFLWISEWGVIQSSDLTRSEEILTGALPSVGDGVCVVETTWKGGRNGHLWSLVKSALETPEEQKGPLDWRVRRCSPTRLRIDLWQPVCQPLIADLGWDHRG